MSRAAAAHDRAESVFAVEECHLPEKAINSLWPQLEFDAGSDIERVSIRQGTGGELMLLLESPFARDARYGPGSRDLRRAYL